MASESVPLHVFEVLEEELVSLYGPIPLSQVLLVEIPDDRRENFEGTRNTRVVEVALDWSFRRGHLKDPVGLAADLLVDESAGNRTRRPSAL